MHTIASAAAAVGRNKTAILRAIKAGKISVVKDENGEWQIDPAELHRIYSPLRSPSMRGNDMHPQLHQSPLLRVRPISSSRITEFSQHEANGCEAQEDQAAEVEIFPVLGKPAATIEPRNGALDDPSTRQNDEAFGPI